MWWRRTPRHLPYPQGPYVPGCFDLMTEYSPDGCFLRLYYPTSLPDIESFSSKWISWLPNGLYYNAFAYVINIWSFLIKLVFKLFAGNMKIPAVWEAELRKETEKFPVIVFSHGLGATRFFYSTICLELASRGFVVAAVEHREKSACTSFFYASAEERRLCKQTRIDFDKIPLGWSHLPARQKQVRKRVTECQKVVDLLEALNQGNPIDNIMGGTFDLGQIKGRLDLTRLVMMGHSFGGATALRVLGSDSRFKIGVVLDGWMFPLKEDNDLPPLITQPLIFVNTQTFQIAANVSVMERFMEVNTDENVERKGYTMKNTTHEHQADSPFLVGFWLNFFMKKLDALTAIRINNHLILSFLQKHVGLPSGNIGIEFLNSQRENYVEALSA